MKKYYGPIVMGLAALTLGAAATQTSVKADKEASSTDTKTTPTDLTKAPLVLKTNSKVIPEVTLTVDISKATPNADMTITFEPDKSFSDQKLVDGQEITAHVSADGQSVSTNDILKFEQSGTDEPDTPTDKPTVKVTAPTNGVIAATGEKIQLDPQDFTLHLGKGDLAFFDAGNNYQFYNNKDKTSTHSIEVTTDKDGKVIVPADYLDKDGNVTLVDDISVKSLKDDIADAKNITKSYTSPNNQKDLDEINANLAKDLDAVKFPADGTTPSSVELHQIKKDIQDIIEKYTTTIHLGDNTAQGNVPIIKSGNVTFPLLNNEYLAVSFDKDGKMNSITVTDKNGKSIKTNTKIQAWAGTLNTPKPDDSDLIVNHNEKLSNNNGGGHINNNNNHVTTPDNNAKPEQSKSIVSHPTTFYVLPNNMVRLYSENGTLLDSRALGGNSSWHADKLLILNGVSYLRVATGEFAKLNDGLEVTPLSQSVITANESRLYTATGELVGNRALGKNTAWRTDKSAIINGQKMYRVATNEWLRAVDVK